MIEAWFFTELWCQLLKHIVATISKSLTRGGGEFCGKKTHIKIFDMFFMINKASVADVRPTENAVHS